MKLSITPIGDSHSKVENVPIGYDVKLNDISLKAIDNNMKVTELNLNMRAGQKPELIIHADANPVMIENLLTNVKIKRNNFNK